MAQVKDSVLWDLLGRVASPLVDFITLLLSIKLSHVLVSRFESRGIGNIILILCVYFLMCAGIWMGKKLESRPPAPVDITVLEDKAGPKGSGEKTRAAIEKTDGGSSAWVVAPAWFFTFFILFMLAETGGVFIEGSKLGARLDELIHRPLWLLLSILISGIIILLFPLLLMKKSRPRIAFDSSSHVIWRTFCVVAVNTMILVTAAFWEWYLLGAEPMEMALGGKIFVFIFAYIIFLLFYAPPRLALLSLERDNLSITSYLAVLAVILWRLMY